jgi:UDP-N-acetylmuramoylalanine--D-glutamate ligase
VTLSTAVSRSSRRLDGDLADPGALADRAVTVLGLGSFGGGVAVTRYLVSRGARVTVTDQKSEADLGPSVEALRGLPVKLVLGRHEPADLLEADLVVKNPAIPWSSPWVQQVRAAGVPITSELVLGLERLAVPYAMVTGSKGKSTTSTLLGAMAGGGGAPVAVAGNNERPLLDALGRLDAPDARAVLEVSSFMADDVAAARARGVALRPPEVVVFTLLEPEHLNWHGTVEAYYEAKLSLLDLGPRLCVIPADDRELAARVPGRLQPGTRLVRVSATRGPGGRVDVGVVDGRAVDRDGQRLFDLRALRLLGAHNRENALLAAAAARALGADPAAIAAGASVVEPLLHRLEPVVTSAQGVRFVNDSCATTPNAAMAALEAVPGPVVLLLGGSDKGHSWGELARAAAARAHAVVCLGQTGPAIADAVEAAVASGAGGARVLRSPGGFDQAFAAALAACPAGGAVLLAPATASYDMFPNFKARGERFRQLAREASVPHLEGGTSPK